MDYKLNIISKKNTTVIYIFLILIILSVFGQVHQYDFINLDDPFYVTNNGYVQSGISMEGIRWAFSTTYAQYWHPLTWLSLMLDYQIFGFNAGAYHIINVCFHILNTLLLFWLFQRMTGEVWKSFFVAAVLALHPLQVESVSWIAKRRDLLCAFFFMLTLCFYVFYAEKRVAGRYILVVFSFICSLMCKPMTVTLPIVMILIDYWPLNRIRLKDPGTYFANHVEEESTKAKQEVLKENAFPHPNFKSVKTKFAKMIPLWQLKEKIPFFVLSVVFSIITLNALDNLHMKNFPFDSRLNNALFSFVTYLVKIIWPHNLTVLNLFTDEIPVWQCLGSAVLFIVISVVLILVMKQLPYLFVGWCWYTITILPTLGFIQYGYLAMSDHHIYLPLVGIGIMLVWGIPDLFTNESIRNKILFPMGIVIIVIMACIAWRQCGYWKNNVKLYNNTLKLTKNNFVAYNNIGLAKYKENKIQDAIDYYNIAIDINTSYAGAYINRGSAYNALGQYQKAINDSTEAIRLDPYEPKAYYVRGDAYARLGQYQQAIKEFDKGIQIKVKLNDTTGYGNRGNAYFKMGKYWEAIDDYTEAIKLNLDKVKCYVNRGNAYSKLKQYQLAIEDYNQAIRLNPNYSSAYYNRGTIYAKLGKYKLAIEDYNETIALGNNSYNAYNNRGFIYYKCGLYQQAMSDYSDAIRLEPAYADAYHNRAVAYLEHDENKFGCRDAQRACDLGNCTLLETTKGKKLCRKIR